MPLLPWPDNEALFVAEVNVILSLFFPVPASCHTQVLWKLLVGVFKCNWKANFYELKEGEAEFII